MRNKAFAATLFLCSAVALGDVNDSARQAPWPNSFFVMNGSPILRAVLTPTTGTAEDNLTANGGAAVTYTFVGGERICVQSPDNAYVQVIAAASMTASGALAFRVNANESLWSNCFTLRMGETKISADCVAAATNCTGVKLFEMR